MDTRRRSLSHGPLPLERHDVPKSPKSLSLCMDLSVLGAKCVVKWHL